MTALWQNIVILKNNAGFVISCNAAGSIPRQNSFIAR